MNFALKTRNFVSKMMNFAGSILVAALCRGRVASPGNVVINVVNVILNIIIISIIQSPIVIVGLNSVLGAGT